MTTNSLPAFRLTVALATDPHTTIVLSLSYVETLSKDRGLRARLTATRYYRDILLSCHFIAGRDVKDGLAPLLSIAEARVEALIAKGYTRV
jgi:hypothetical protein